MSTSKTYFPSTAGTAPKRRNVFRLFLIFGGAMMGLLSLLLRDPRALVALFDNDHDLDLIRDQYPNHTIPMFALGQGETTWTMMEERLVGNSTTHGGFGGRLRTAELAARKLVASKDFFDFCASLRSEALTRCGGCVKLVQVESNGSLSGAACAGAAQIVGDAIFRGLISLGCPIEHTSTILGPMTFEGLAERARPNFASALVPTIGATIHGAADLDRVARYIDLFELPPYHDDIAQRNRLILFDGVANHSTEVENYRRLIRSNLSNSGQLGNLVSRQTDFKEGLDEHRDIASPVATLLKADLDDQIASAQATPQLVDQLRWQDESVVQVRVSVSDVLDRIDAPGTGEHLRALLTPPAQHHFRVFAVTAHGDEFLLERVDSDFSVLPDTIADFTARVRLLRTFDQALTAELSNVRADHAALETSIAALSDEFEEVHQRLVRRRFFSLSAIHAELGTLGEQIQTHGDRLALREAESQALKRAHAAVEKELQFHLGAIEAVKKELDKYVPRGSLQQPHNYVVVRHIGEAFGRLMQLPQQNPTEQTRTLCSLAAELLPSGLASIVHAPSDRLESIAHAIVHGEYDIIGPPHGGRERQHKGKTLYVLPPLEAHSRKLLPPLILRRNRQAKVLFADTLEFGATVVRMRLHTFVDLNDVFAGLAGTDLHQAYTERFAALNSQDDFESLRALGGKIEGDRIVFTDTTPDAV